MHRRHDPTYYWATRRLPAEIRPATHALYGYVRTADEIVDGPRRPASAEARRAALDAWERRARARAGRRPLAAPRRRRAGRRRPPPPAAARRAAHLHALDADRLRAGADRDVAGARGLHGRLGRLGRAHHGAAARRAGAPPRRLRAARAGVPARQLHPRRARGHEPRPRLPAGRGPRALRRARRPTCAREHASPELRALLAHEVRRARGAVRRGRAGDRGGAGVGAQRRALRGRRSTCACSTASSGSTSTCSAGARACARGRCRAPRWERCAGDAPGDAARRGAHAARRRRRARRRAGLRRQLRRARGRARARRRRRRRARRRPLRDRRAPDVGVRGADAVAARDGRARGDPPGAAVHGVPHAARLGALPAAVELVLVRLPHALPRAVGAGGRALRGRARNVAEAAPRRSPGASARRGAADSVAERETPSASYRPRPAHRAAGRRRARLAPRARRRRRTCSRPRR